jgi:hypothetical protein
MPDQALIPLLLEKSIDTSAVERDLTTWDAQSLILKNTGICREGGVTNLAVDIGLDQDYEETFYCSNGSKAQLKRDIVNKCFQVYSDGRNIGKVPLWGVKSRKLLSANVADVQITITGTLLLLYFAQGLATIEEVNRDTFERLNIRSFNIPTGLADIKFVRYTQPTYATVLSIAAYSFVYTPTPLVTAYILNQAGTVFSGTINVSSLSNGVSINAFYSHGWLLEIGIWTGYALTRNLWMINTLGIGSQIAPATAITLALMQVYNPTTGIVVYKTWILVSLYTNYECIFTPPAIDGDPWTYSLVGLGQPQTAKKVVTYGGLGINLTTPATYLFTALKNERTWVTNQTDVPEIYGNIFPELPDFALKLHTIAGNASYISFSFDRDGIGCPITEIGELNPYYCPHSLKIDTNTCLVTYQRGDNAFAMIEISDDEYLRMQEIKAGIVKINCASGLNIADTVTGDLKMGGNAFNGFAVIGFSSEGAWAARHRGEYGGSVDGGYKNNTATHAGIVTFIEIPESVQFSPNNELIDIFVGLPPSSLNYFGSIQSGLGQAFNPSLLGTIYVDDQTLPIPIQSEIVERSARLIKSTALRQPDYDGYQLGNEIPGLYDSFVLYSNVYFVDSEWIKGLVVSAGNALQSAAKIVPVRGLRFLTASPTEAYFISAFDNSLFSFNGGQSVGKQALFNRREPINDGIYSVVENTLALLADSAVIFIRDGIISESPLPWSSSPKPFATVDGIWLAKDGYAERFMFNAMSAVAPPSGDIIDGGTWGVAYADTLDGGTWGNTYDILDGGTWGNAGEQITALLWQSKFIGYSDRSLQMIDRFVIRVYKEDKAQATVTVTYEYFDEASQYLETRDYIIGDIANPWDSEGYASIEYVPLQKRSISASLRVESAEKIVLLAATATVTKAGTTVVVNR